MYKRQASPARGGLRSARRTLYQDTPPPPGSADSYSERFLTVAHRVVAAGLVVCSAGGLAFVGVGCWEIYDRNMKIKAARARERAD